MSVAVSSSPFRLCFSVFAHPELQEIKIIKYYANASVVLALDYCLPSTARNKDIRYRHAIVTVVIALDVNWLNCLGPFISDLDDINDAQWNSRRTLWNSNHSTLYVNISEPS